MRIIAGTARSRIIEAPPGKDTRPTLDRVRENLFNMIQSRIIDSRVLDLFAGSGALSFEAISRGASFAVLCDHDRSANRVELSNAAKLDFTDKTRILLCDWAAALRMLQNGKERFDIVFLDPPYVMTDLREVMTQIECLLAEDGIVVIEHEAKSRPVVSDHYDVFKERNWGYCGISIYQLNSRSEHAERRGEE